MVKISGDYQGDLHCRATHGPSGRVLETDAPVDNQGRGESFSPTDLVATALATCMTTVMGIVARRHQIDLRGLRFEVTKEMSADAPRRIVRLATDIWMPIRRDAAPPNLFENAAHSCPVHQSLHPAVEKPLVFHWQGE